MSPHRVPITSPESGVIPIDVSTERLSWIAAIEQPFSDIGSDALRENMDRQDSEYRQGGQSPASGIATKPEIPLDFVPESRSFNKAIIGAVCVVVLCIVAVAAYFLRPEGRPRPG